MFFIISLSIPTAPGKRKKWKEESYGEKNKDVLLESMV